MKYGYINYRSFDSIFSGLDASMEKRAGNASLKLGYVRPGMVGKTAKIIAWRSK